MNKISDPLDVLAELEPVMLAQLADEGYARRRHGDLVRVAADAARRSRPTRVRVRNSRPVAVRPRQVLLAGSVAVAAAAVAATAVAVALPGRQHSPAAAVPHGALNARGFLLTSADVMARGSATAGTYWYIKERDFEPSAARPRNAPRRGLGKIPPKVLTFGATYAATEESWLGQRGLRTIVAEDLRFQFASAADKTRWQAAGSPALSGPAGFGRTGPVTSNYTMTFHWGLGKSQLTFAGVRGLPTTAAGLGKVLRRMWSTEPDKAAAVGVPHPDFGQYLVGWAGMLLTSPARPGTKSAIYRLLAAQPGISIVDKVTDPLGRTGDAVSDGAGDYLLIDPATAQLLAYTTNSVHPHSVIPATGGVEVYEAMGWTSQLGVPAQP